MSEEDVKKFLLQGGTAAAGGALIASSFQKKLPAKILFPAALLSLSGYGYLKNKERRHQLSLEGELTKSAFWRGFSHRSSDKPTWSTPTEGDAESQAPADPIPSA